MHGGREEEKMEKIISRQFREILQRCEKSEKELNELQKKYDELKKNYNDTRISYSKAKEDIEKLKSHDTSHKS